MAQFFIGISGWKYKGWRGVFYPHDLNQEKELEFASRQFTSIEVNSSFYSLKTPGTYRAWYVSTPENFILALKAPRFITHIKRLRDVRIPLANFFASGVFELKEKLGPILWQLPPNFKFNETTIDSFLSQLPHDLFGAQKLARRHDHHIKSRAYLNVDKNRSLRHAIEVRHPSFACIEFVELLRRHNVALVFAKAKKSWPYFEDVTADFIYARMHGEKELYKSGYSQSLLATIAMRLATWQAGGVPKDAETIGLVKTVAEPRDVYVYFDNDVKVRAPYDAQKLLGLLSDFHPAHPMKKPNLKKLKGEIYGPRVSPP